jgi:hypothetical protein
MLTLVASTGIEPVSGASETLILSIVLRGQKNYRFLLHASTNPPPALRATPASGGYAPFARSHHLIKCPTLLVNIFTAIASKTTPKNLRTAANPAGPSSLAIYFNDLKVT